ncbi:ABC transporter permease (plasmid) [Desulfobaculum bizertense]|uniref:ABC transporter permease n=1 Tax=Desulfobaculum bizertense TaxID=376490 RepID=UPI001F29C10A|nr:ABC transporter permease [Desulfobaculum bizertense]UIJ39538.1 ABC transporter permease [Desulfobaculum bizertense]
MGFSLLAILIVMVASKTDFHWTLALAWVPLLFLFLFCCGVGMIVSALSVQFRDVQHLYNVLILAWMYATPIFYPISAVPEEVRGLIEFNVSHHVFFERTRLVWKNSWT